MHVRRGSAFYMGWEKGLQGEEQLNAVHSRRNHSMEVHISVREKCPQYSLFKDRRVEERKFKAEKVKSRK